MKLAITTVAAIFFLLVLIIPGRASADPGNWQPQTIQQIGYQPYNASYWGYYPYACRDRHFRRHHPFLCW